MHLSLSVAVPAQVQSQATETEDELAFVRRATIDVRQNVDDVAKQVIALREQFQRDEQELKRGMVGAARLERARRATDSARSRLEAIKVRLQARRDALDESREQQAQLASALAQMKAAADTDPEALRAAEQRLEQQTQLSSALEELVASLETLQVEAESRALLAREYFELLQARFTYSLEATAEPERTSPERRALKRSVQSLIDEAARARSRARQLPDDGDDATARRKRLFVAEARAAEERAELAQMNLRLLRTESALENLKALLREESVPLAAFREAAGSIDTLADRLAQERDAIERLDRVLRGQLETLRPGDAAGGDGEEGSERAIVEAVQADLEQQRARIESIDELYAETRKQLDAVIAERERTALGERRELPPDAAGWRRLGRALVRLPGRIAEAIGESFDTVRVGLASADTSKLLRIALMTVALVLGAGVVRVVARRVLAAQPDGVLSTPMEILLAAITPAALLPAWWLAAGTMLDVTFGQLYLVFILLLLWPVIQCVMRLIRYWIPVDQNEDETWGRFYREMWWIVSIGAALAALIAISRAVALSPAVLDVLDRVAMLALLFLAIPALKLRSTLVTISRNAENLRVWHRVVVFMSGLIPLLVSLCALTGLAGYVNLAWNIAEHLAWLAVVVIVWLFAWTMSRDGMRTWTSHSMERGESGEFWAKNVLSPLNNLLGLALLVLAGVALVKTYGWTAETPGVSWIHAALTQPVFSIGSARITVLGLLSTMIVILVVFWAGGWSKQVSYRWVYGRIADAGIRQSLSTFTQYIVIVLGLMLALKTIGLDLTALTVFAGALGVGIGFGLQNITSNFISGILLLIERPLRATDVVSVDKYEGEVTHIGIRSLSVKTFDNQEVVIPNSAVITQPFINWTRGDDLMRTVLEIGISYDDDPERAIELVRDVITSHSAVVATPAPKVLLWDFLDSSVLIRSQFFSHVKGSVGRADLRSQILLAIWKVFREEKITIPYPQRDVHLSSAVVPADRLAGPDPEPGVA